VVRISNFTEHFLLLMVMRKCPFYLFASECMPIGKVIDLIILHVQIAIFVEIATDVPPAEMTRHARHQLPNPPGAELGAVLYSS